jgi:hypothetical protein
MGESGSISLEVSNPNDEKWRWMQSAANPSPGEFPLTGKNTGNFLEVWGAKDWFPQ